jgi:hypothetical protein
MKGVIILGIAVLAFIGIILFYKRSSRIVDQVEPLGPFGLVTHRTQYRYGWNEGMSRTGTEEHYSLRYKGQPFTFTGKSGMDGDDTAHYQHMNSLITFPSPEPAVVVNVGDPNNSSFYYLVREVTGAAVAEHIGDGSGEVSASWLDPVSPAPAAVADIALHRGRMEGGRFLLLGRSTVLDTRDLTVHRIAPHDGAFENQFKPPMALSPDQTSFVRWGSGDAPENQPLLIVFDFVAATSYVLPVDRSVMRYNDWEEIDRAWLDHYFEWRKGANGHDQLVARSGVTSLPYRGQMSGGPGDSYREYRLMPVTPEMKDTLAAFIEREMGGVRQPPAPQFGESVIVFQLGAHTVFVSDHEDHASVYSDHESDSGRAVEAIAKRFDEALKTRKYDHLFTAGEDE